MTPQTPRPTPRQVDASQRVRVTAPPRRRKSVPLTRSREIDTGTELGEVLLNSLMREQRRLGARTLLALCCLVLPVPLLVMAFPQVSSGQLAGLPVMWWVLGLAPFPVLYLLGRWFLLRCESIERTFTSLVEEDA